MAKSETKTYLVTGAAGFIGTRFVESCGNRGISVISVDRPELFGGRPENQGVDFGTIVDLEKLGDWLKQTHVPIDAIIHLGAITDTRESDLDLLQRLNLAYSQMVWTYASTQQVPLIYASSAATYGSGDMGYDDREELIPQLSALNAYGDSKLKFDLWALEQERHRIHPPQWAGFKFFNVYGFGERHKGFMSSVVLHAFDEISKSGKVTLFKSHREGIADGQQKRDFVYVADVVDVIHFAIDKPIPRGIYNLGSGQARSFLDLARAVFHALGKPENVQFVDTPLSIRDKYQYFTEAEMERLRGLGYNQPFTSLEEGVRQYVERLTVRNGV
jgi:ADP-L-glycero-D-manno-heptose 6-epimerase